MKVEDLMVDDWIENTENWLKDSNAKEFEQIESINKYSVNTVHSEYISEDNIKPISITPEILEKNGFIRWKQSSLYQYDKNGIHIGYNFYTQGCGFYIKNECDIEFKKNFQYVHELQHALKLCKIDKEIEL